MPAATAECSGGPDRSAADDATSTHQTPRPEGFIGREDTTARSAFGMSRCWAVRSRRTPGACGGLLQTRA
jgi:hypothetical protein